MSFVEAFPQVIALAELKAQTALTDLALVHKGSRLSVMPVTEAQWTAILLLK